jgi:hypothetical protein
MKARAIFFVGAPAFSVLCAMFFTGGWLSYDHNATAGEKRWHQNELDGSEEGEVAETRVLGDTYLFLLKIVPASILAAWFVISWIVFGRDAFRLETIKSLFSALK